MATRQSNIKVNIVGDASDFRAALNQSEAGLKGFDRQLTTMNSSLKSIKWDLFKAKAVAFGYALVQVGRQLWSLAEAGADYNETLNKMNVIYGSNSEAMLKWVRESNAAMVSSEQEVMNAVAAYQLMYENMGFTASEAEKLSKSTVELAADLASFNNTSYVEAHDAISAAYRGEYEQLEKLNIFIKENDVQREAVRLGLIEQGEELDKHSRALAIDSLITQQSSAAQGDLERTMGSASNQIKAFRANLADLRDKYGAALAPLLERFLPGINAELEKLGSDENIEKFSRKVEEFGDYIEYTFIPAVKDMWESFKGTDWESAEQTLKDMGGLLEDIYNGLQPIREAIGFMWDTFNKLPDGLKEFLILLAGLRWLAGGAVLRILVTGPIKGVSDALRQGATPATGDTATDVLSNARLTKIEADIVTLKADDIQDIKYLGELRLQIAGLRRELDATSIRYIQDRAEIEARIKKVEAEATRIEARVNSKFTDVEVDLRQQDAQIRAIQAENKAQDVRLATSTTGKSMWGRIVSHIPVIGDIAFLAFDIFTMLKWFGSGWRERLDNNVNGLRDDFIAAQAEYANFKGNYTTTKAALEKSDYSQRMDILNNQSLAVKWYAEHKGDNASTRAWARLKVDEEAAVRATGDKDLIRKYEKAQRDLADQAAVDRRLDGSVRSEIANRKAGDAEDRARINAERIARINKDGALNAKDQSLQYQVNQLKRGFAIGPGNKPLPISAYSMAPTSFELTPRSTVTTGKAKEQTAPTYNITVNTMVADRNTGKRIVSAIQEYEYAAGTTWRNR